MAERERSSPFYKPLILLAGALAMRIKGGGHGFLRNKITNPALHRALDGKILAASIFGCLCFSDGFAWWQALMMAAAFFAAMAPSIGEEIGAIGGIKGNWFSDRDSWFASQWFDVADDRLWGWVSGTARGIFSGILLALPALDPWFIAAGAAFAPCYFAGVSIEQVSTRILNPDWHLGEWIYGAVLVLPLLFN